MRPLTDSIPKPLIPVCGIPVLDHIAAALPDAIDELVLVVGYRKEQIINHCGKEYAGRKVTYVEQPVFDAGTGDALMRARDAVQERFLFMYADDIHGKDALERVVGEEHAMLAMRSDMPQHFGVVVQREDGTLREIIEKPKNPPTNLINIGGFVVTPDIFSYAVPMSEDHGELLVTDMLTAYAQDHPVKIIEQDFWLPVGRIEDIERAAQTLGCR